MTGDGGATDLPVEKELEVLLAEIENRLRRTIIRIVRPTLDQQADMQSRLDVIDRKVDDHEQILNISDELKQEVNKQGEIVGVLREQLNMAERQSRSFEKTTLSTISDVRNHITDNEVKLEEHSTDLQRVHRETTRIWDGVERLQKETEGQVKRIWENFSGLGKKHEKLRDEMLSNIGEVEKRHNALLDDLFGDNKGLTKLRADLTELTKFCEPLPRIEKDIEVLQRDVSDLQYRQEECEVFCKKADRLYHEFTDNCTEQLANMAEEFRVSMNQLVAHHASLMKGMRTDFHGELEAMKKLRDGMTDFETKTSQYCSDIATDLLTESKRLDSIHKQLTQEAHEVQLRRKRERAAHEAEMREVKRDAHIQQEVVSSFHSSLAHLSRVLGLVLEGERVTGALHVQDYVDRLSQQWLGRPEEIDQRAQPPCTAETLEKLPRKFPGDSNIAGNPSMHKLVPIDPRQGLAKLVYLPGRVSYGGSHYDRQDMLMLQNKLLSKAYSAYERGPPKDSVLTSLKQLEVCPQPSARGGAAGTDLNSAPRVGAGRPKKNFGDGSMNTTAMDTTAGGYSEYPKSTAASTNGFSAGAKGQRPGSQGHRPGSTGQPQGTGSRGTMFGSLGETEPPSDAYRPEGLGILTTEGRQGSKGSKPAGGAKGFRLPTIDVTGGVADSGSSTARELRQPSSTDAQKTGPRSAR